MRVLAIVLGLVVAAVWLGATDPAAAQGTPKQEESAGPALDNNATCLGCHGTEGFSMPGPDGKKQEITFQAQE